MDMALLFQGSYLFQGINTFIYLLLINMNEAPSINFDTWSLP